MDIKEILKKVRLACQYISDNNSSVWHTNEWNICSHLRSRLEEEFTGYDVDVELVKEDGRRPDIIVHRRGDNSDNLIVFQAKIDPTLKDLQEDLKKINETFFQEPYLYKFGVFISIGEYPKPLPNFDLTRIGIMEVYGSILFEEKDEDKKGFKSDSLV